MPRELITLQVGQCGNQIGCKFWDLALREHAANNKNGIFDDALSSFFRNVDTRYDDPVEIPVGNGKGKIKALKARAVLIDMEEGVVNEILRDKTLSELFDTRQSIAGSSGSGNNWAQGHFEYGPKYEEEIIERIRRPVEFCDSLQSFLMIHSLGGGTGSGFGTYILSLLQDHFPDAYRFTTAVFPSEDDDVITSPYNSLLSLRQLIDHSDCVLPLDNASLADISGRISGKSNAEPTYDAKGKKVRPFDSMNSIAAHLLLNLTSSMRFGGSLNVDLNEITMNLVPYPRMHFLVSSVAPLLYSADPKSVNFPPRSLDQMFTDAFSPSYQLIRADPKRDIYLACMLMVRGAGVEMSDIRRNIERMRPNLNFIHWNQEGWKVGHCLTPAIGQRDSLLCLSNNCCIKDTFQDVVNRFKKLYTRKAHLHHYLNYMDKDVFEDSLDTVRSLIDAYSALQHRQAPAPPRLVPIV
eukprot:TRINITY_DN2699_c0_g1_i1.p1 TRINITY_DN2699_c0_g1~~TRINITY_DN2699_c0_g1_i1.p1  ORF type:complete len:466 (-),score=188.35 TRINITY_DN2699_c0_g1_i1:352-1749(-)